MSKTQDTPKRDMVFPVEFEQFFKAMSNEMCRHNKEKGASWKNKTITVGIMYPTHADYNLGQGIPQTMEMVGYLEELLKQCIDNFLKKNDKNELVDIANICGMLWCRKAVLAKATEGSV